MVIEFMLVYFEYTILLKPALGGVRDVELFSICYEQTQKEKRVWCTRSLYNFLATKLKNLLFQNLFINFMGSCTNFH